MTTISSTSTSSFYSTSADTLASLQQQIDAVSNSISTGNQYSSASQNPAASAQMRMMQLQDAQATTDAALADKASTNLQMADSAMSEIVNDINQAKTLATQAANGTLSTSDRAAIGAQLAQIQTSLLGLANSKDANGNALFGGGSTGAAYTQNADGTVSYTGNATSQTLPIGGGQSVQISVTGPEMLNYTDSSGNSVNIIDTIGTLAKSLEAGGSTAQSDASTALDSLSSGLSAVTSAQTVVGARESWITLNSQSQTSFNTARATEESHVGDTDVSTAAVKLQQLTTALQASQSTFTRVSSLSLFDVIGNT
jgi:flagellar hook-associated protein 3 FlgL